MKRSLFIGSSTNLRSRSVSNTMELQSEKEKKKTSRPILKAVSPESRVNVNFMNMITIQIIIYCTNTNIVLSDESSLETVYVKVCSKMKTLFGIPIDVDDFELQSNFGEIVTSLQWEELKLGIQIYLHIAFTNSTIFKQFMSEVDSPKHSELISLMPRTSVNDDFVSLAIIFPEQQRTVVFVPRDTTIDKIVDDAIKAGYSQYNFTGKKYEYGLSLRFDSNPVASTVRLKDLKNVISFGEDGQCPELFLRKITKVKRDAIDMMINIPHPQKLQPKGTVSEDVNRNEKYKVKSSMSLQDESIEEIRSIPFFVEFVLPKSQKIQVLCNTGWSMNALRSKIEKAAKDKFNISINCGGFNFEVNGNILTESVLYQNEDIKRLVNIGKKFTILLIKKELSLFPSFKNSTITSRLSESDLNKNSNLKSSISDSGISFLRPESSKIWKSIAKLARINYPFLGLQDTFISQLYEKMDRKAPVFFNMRDTFLYNGSNDDLRVSAVLNEENSLDLSEMISTVKFIQVTLLGQIPFNFPFDSDMTELDVRKKAILKITKLLSQNVAQQDLELTSANNDKFSENQLLISHPFVVDCLHKLKIPTLIINSKTTNISLNDAVNRAVSDKKPVIKRSADSLENLSISNSNAQFDRNLELKMFLVVVKLPQNVHTNFVLSKYSDFSVILDKTSSKITSLLGQVIDAEMLCIQGEYGLEMFDKSQQVLECEYVRNCIKHNMDPTFIIKLNPNVKTSKEIRDMFNAKSIEHEDELPANSVKQNKSSSRITVESIAKEMEKTHVLAKKAKINKNKLNSIETVKITITDEDSKELTSISVDTYITMAEIKKFAISKVDHKSSVYTFKYRDGTDFIEVFDDLQILQTTNLYLKSNKKVSLMLCEKQQHVIGSVEKKIASLMGVGYRKYELFRSDVYPILRRRLLSLCKTAQSTRNLTIYHLNPQVDFSPLPSYLQGLLKNNPIITLRIFSSIGPGSFKTVSCTPFERPFDVIVKYIGKIANNNATTGTAAIPAASNYILKSISTGEVIYGEYPLISFSCFKNEVFKGAKLIELVIKQKIDTSTTPSNINEDLIDDSKPYISDHTLLSIENNKTSEIKILSMWDIYKEFRVKILNIENASGTDVYVHSGLYFGGEELCPSISTPINHKNMFFNMWLNFELATMNIPKNARLCLTVYQKHLDAFVPLGWINILLVDFRSHLLQGKQSFRLWPHEKGNPLGTIFSSNDKDHPLINLKFQEYSTPVTCPDFIEQDIHEVSDDTRFAIDVNDMDELDRILLFDPLTKLTAAEKQFIWKYRYCITDRTEALPKLVMSTKWNDLNSVLEMKRVLKLFNEVPLDVALGLLDSYVSDSDIRRFAVINLENHLGDYQLVDVMLQLTQALKYEPRLDSELARFLLKRSVLNKSIGHAFFWYLKADIHRPDVSTLFAILIECYLLASPDHMEELIKQNMLLKQINDTALAIKKSISAERTRVLKNMLSGLKLESGFALPLNPNQSLNSINLKKCKVMDSKKLPLWIVFENSERYGEEIPIIYKSGDDLRQDMLTLQMLRLMDKIWHSEGLDMRLAPYECLSTGPDMGLIQVVKNAWTVSGIQLSLGGSAAAFKEDPLDQWLRQMNPEDKDYLKAVEMFTLSCAGYCVATYCLGIGDRHNDNIMLTKDGRLFHIDFGHFLGNIKRKFGIKRERCPFVLTPDFIYIIGKKDSPNFLRFIDLCIKAYIIIRRQANMFINLFAMVINNNLDD
eukprot:NODE_80_length_22829_cov_0.188121.p1 type:complete len:1735 gc:universal NODE_80_length_22829_cov_0.188121:22262-17058(-)